MIGSAENRYKHVENAGVHSGDATLVLPPQDLEESTVRQVEQATAKVAQALNVTGPMNIQFIAKNNEIKVIECNLRASRNSNSCNYNNTTSTISVTLTCSNSNQRRLI